MTKSTTNSITSTQPQSQDNTMTQLFIDNGVSIPLETYMKDPIAKFERTPPMFVPKAVGERLAIAEFTGNFEKLREIRQWWNANLKTTRYLQASRAYNETWEGLRRANPNGFKA